MLVVITVLAVMLVLGVLLLFQIVASGQTDLSTVDPEIPPPPVDRDTTGDALLDAQVSATSGKDQEAAEETLEAAESVIVAGEDISEKASSVAGRWNSLSKNQKVIVTLLTFATVAFAFVSSGYQF